MVPTAVMLRFARLVRHAEWTLTRETGISDTTGGGGGVCCFLTAQHTYSHRRDSLKMHAKNSGAGRRQTDIPTSETRLRNENLTDTM